jgi:pyrroloquinoline-quinone synthase
MSKLAHIRPAASAPPGALSRSALSAPPAAPFPELERPLAPEGLEAGLRAFSTSYYAVHPFHTRMHAGTLTRRELQGWVANRLCYQRAIPRKDGAIVSNCPLPEVRRHWIQRIADHDGDGTDAAPGGIEMWVRLGEAVGVPREEMLDERHVLPGVRMAAEGYVTFCKTRPWVEAVASSLTELFAPSLMHQRLAAFPRHYPWVDAAGLEYFRSRLVQAPRDSTHGLEIVKAHCTTVESQRKAFEALAFKLEMLWVMIDTIHHAYAE